MSRPIRKIVIVGGGTAGWITACVVAAESLKRGDGAVEVVLIESPDIPIIGVGEGTWPSMRMTLQRIGLAEDDLVRESSASFKQGTRFRGWSGLSGNPEYVHPFSLPLEYSDLNPAKYWLAHGSSTPFADLVTPQARVIELGLAPKQAGAPHYAFTVNYGYHFDAGAFAGLLHRHAVGKLGVQYIAGNVEGIESDVDGDIAAVALDTGERVPGDLFVDCTGQKALLIGAHFGSPLASVKDVLFNDRAIAVQVPYAEPGDPIAPVTLSTAQPHGWIWDIGLSSRRGVGYVHSSAHADEETALEALKTYVEETSPGIDLAGLGYRTIPFEPGYRERFWIGNCVAVGLSAGFVEPLEASALVLIEQSAAIIGEQLPRDREIMDVVAGRFNDKMRYHWLRIVEFLKLHYAVSAREDSDYWKENRAQETWPESLREKITLWQQQPPWHDDAPRLDELFPSASYQYVLYGMGFRPRYGATGEAQDERMRKRADEVFHGARMKAQQMARLLPETRELINAITNRAAA
ncbi:MAG: tryptophan 7-halogenase [Acidimicrobiia bacterium]|nr:tryptophan 7-halogenase [Acidimicrobiia bacterium]